jgi:hypothetical protein
VICHGASKILSEKTRGDSSVVLLPGFLWCRQESKIGPKSGHFEEFAENPGSGGLSGGWRSLMRLQSLRSNSLIYRENTGKFLNFEPDLKSARIETAVATDAFPQNSREFGTRELILNNSEGPPRSQGVKSGHQGIGAKDRSKGLSR